MSKYDTAGMQYPPDTGGGDFKPLPKGKYKVIATKMIEKPSSNKPNNSVIHCDLQVVEGQYTGRLLWFYINICNSNEEVQARAVGDLKAIIESVGESGTDDFRNLEMKPFTIDVGIGESTYKGETKPENKIWGVVRPEGYQSSTLAGGGNIVTNGSVVEEPLVADDIPF